jgi:hypothetical protein
MSNEHKLLIIPGLNDQQNRALEIMVALASVGLHPVISAVGWHDGEVSF